MAKRTIIVSDLSGVEVPEEEGATIRVTYWGEDKVKELQVTKAEADELTAHEGVREVKKRGRKAAAAAK